ncbi:MAG: hypothetical protein MI757_07430 [Pirellulales bacterium]|nr:hypothetical protein [Pirellulales bacterium]
MTSATRLLISCAAVLSLAVGVISAHAAEPYEFAPIEYSKSPTDDAVTKLAAKITAGELSFEYDRTRGYLDALLKALDVPVSSQVLVFSKTSLQINNIWPSTPRAVFFNDDTYIGWVQGAKQIEISTVDPKQGAIFYTLDQDRNKKVVPIRRTHECLACHANSRIGRVPGHVVRSVFPNDDGHPITRAGGTFSDHRTPYEQRWGGWYVSGRHGKLKHMANRLAYERLSGDIVMPPGGQNVTDLTKELRLHAYPSTHSDIVALMVLEHQAMAHNLITQVNYQSRMALHQQAEINKMVGNPEHQMRDATRRRIDNAVENLVAYMLFAEEAELPDQVEGTSTFAREFAARGPVDSKGRSLRQFDLNTRLFKYPLSFSIYTESFDALPNEARERIYQRLFDVLTGKDTSEPYDTLAAADRKAVLEIVRETKKGLPKYWTDRSSAATR